MYFVQREESNDRKHKPFVSATSLNCLSFSSDPSSSPSCEDNSYSSCTFNIFSNNCCVVPEESSKKLPALTRPILVGVMGSLPPDVYSPEDGERLVWPVSLMINNHLNYFEWLDNNRTMRWVSVIYPTTLPNVLRRWTKQPLYKFTKKCLKTYKQ